MVLSCLGCAALHCTATEGRRSGRATPHRHRHKRVTSWWRLAVAGPPPPSLRQQRCGGQKKKINQLTRDALHLCACVQHPCAWHGDGRCCAVCGRRRFRRAAARGFAPSALRRSELRREPSGRSGRVGASWHLQMAMANRPGPPANQNGPWISESCAGANGTADGQGKRWRLRIFLPSVILLNWVILVPRNHI